MKYLELVFHLAPMATDELISGVPKMKKKINTEECLCRLTPVNVTTTDPPEWIVNRYCPIHGDGGPDPDELRDRKMDDAMWDD